MVRSRNCKDPNVVFFQSHVTSSLLGTCVHAHVCTHTHIPQLHLSCVIALMLERKFHTHVKQKAKLRLYAFSSSYCDTEKGKTRYSLRLVVGIPRIIICS
jgi:hypothetical protein